MWLVEQRLGLAELEDGTALRFAVVGTGPIAIYVPGWVSHLELGWALPAEREFYEGLAAGRTLVRYDRPGCGMSGPTDRADLVELELEVLQLVAKTVGAEHFDLIGASFGAPLAVRWAARRPESISRLVLYGGWVDGDAVAAPAVRKHVLGLVDQHWGFASDVLTEIFAPDADAGFRAVFSRYQRESSSAAFARRLLAACYDIDVADDLGRITAPTTVIHRRDDRAVPIAEGARLANGISDATLIVLAGRTHIPFAGDAHSVLNAMRGGLGLPPLDRGTPPSVTPRQLQVAALIAQGWSNRQIADELVITERSAESHVERIRARLGFRSRAQIAAWYVATNPVAGQR
jgi:pimeloyl-ACP methyl ester carboxylesterase/DNA-binding CsgD family transcriptional regulator